MLADLEALAARADGAISVERLAEPAGEPFRPVVAAGPKLAARPFPGTIRERWSITSFTALAMGQEPELPDYDAVTLAGPIEPAGSAGTDQEGIFVFPRGARPGACLHAILERVDFTALERGALESLVQRTLADYGLGTHWTPTVADTVERVCATALDEGTGLRLQDVPASRRLNELEFYYPVAGLSARTLRELLLAHGFAPHGPIREQIEALTFAPARGYMKGFIDLVFEAEGRFYLADYKSNWLGPEPAAYGAEHLAAAMARESYFLQYLIYTVALHRYLRQRVPGYDYERHFGGVFYLFLRGMDPARGSACGIFEDRPAQALIEALDAYLATGRAPGGR